MKRMRKELKTQNYDMLENKSVNSDSDSDSKGRFFKFPSNREVS